MQRADEGSTTKAGGETRSGDREAADGDGERVGGYVAAMVQKGQLSQGEGGEEGSKGWVMVMVWWSSFVRAWRNRERERACAQDRGKRSLKRIESC